MSQLRCVKWGCRLYLEFAWVLDAEGPLRIGPVSGYGWIYWGGSVLVVSRLVFGRGRERSSRKFGGLYILRA